MYRISLMCFGLSISIACTACKAPTQKNTKNKDYRSIMKVIQAFHKGGDIQSVELVASALHPNCQHFFMKGKKVVTLPTKKFLALLGQKKILGISRKLTIHSISIWKTIASAKVSMTNPKKRNDNFLSLMKVNGSWKIMNNILKVKVTK